MGMCGRERGTGGGKKGEETNRDGKKGTHMSSIFTFFGSDSVSKIRSSLP